MVGPGPKWAVVPSMFGQQGIWLRFSYISIVVKHHHQKQFFLKRVYFSPS